MDSGSDGVPASADPNRSHDAVIFTIFFPTKYIIKYIVPSPIVREVATEYRYKRLAIWPRANGYQTSRYHNSSKQ